MNQKSHSVSRRSVLGSGLAATGTILATKGSGQSQSKAKVLALVGDRYHNADYIRVGMSKAFDSLKLKVDYTIQYDAISRKLLGDYQLLLILRDGMIWPDGYLGPDAYTAYEQGFENKSEFPAAKSQTWMTDEQGAAIQEFVKAGNGVYALHNSSHISLGCKKYRDVMGGAYIGHPTLRPFKVYVKNHNHPITKG